jgi:uncharacterized LabA/DUF88 family protein
MSAKVGVFVDSGNIYRNGGKKMNYDVLRDFARRDGAQLIRLNAYIPYYFERAKTDPDYQEGIKDFLSIIRDQGYKAVIKKVKRYIDEDGNEVHKANTDVDLTVDILRNARYLDRILLVTGDGDFVSLLRDVQNVGCRVEVVAFNNVSADLRREADWFVSGYLIPNLLGQERGEKPWGDLGSQVRGTCYHYLSDRGFGRLRYFKRMPDAFSLSRHLDTRDEHYPYATASFHVTELQEQGLAFELPSDELIFAFTLNRSEWNDDQFQAADIELVCDLRSEY